MRFTIESAQKKFFRHNGWLELEGLLDSVEWNRMAKSVEKIFADYPGYPLDRGLFLSRTLPLVPMIRKRGLGDMAYLLVDKRPLRLAYDHTFQNPSSEQKTLFKELTRQPGNICHLLLSFHSVNGTFFVEKGFEHLYFAPNQWYLLLVFSTNVLNDDSYPIVTTS